MRTDELKARALELHRESERRSRHLERLCALTRAARESPESRSDRDLGTINVTNRTLCKIVDLIAGDYLERASEVGKEARELIEHEKAERGGARP